MILETLYRIYSIPGFNIAHVDVTAKLCEEHDIKYQDVERIEAVVNWFETQYPSPAFAPPPAAPGAPVKKGAQEYYTAYGVVKRGFPLLTGTPDPPEVLELMKRVKQMFDPKGLLGRAYWYCVFPLHRFVFGGMLQGIAARGRTEG